MAFDNNKILFSPIKQMKNEEFKWFQHYLFKIKHSVWVFRQINSNWATLGEKAFKNVDHASFQSWKQKVDLLFFSS